MTLPFAYLAVSVTCQQKSQQHLDDDSALLKVLGTRLDDGLRRLENDADLLALVKDCRRNHHLINIYFEHVVSKPHVVDCISKDDNNPKPWTKPQAAKVSVNPTPANNINQKVKDTTKIRSGRQVKATPVDNDSDSHDSYETAEDSLYKPPKIIGDSIYSSDNDSGVDGGQSSRAKKVNLREKHRPANDRARDKAIDTDDSSYEDIESDECSDADSDDNLLKHPKMKHRENALYAQYQPFKKKNDKRLEEYFHEWLTMGMYRRTYQYNMDPVKGQKLWEKTGSPALVPPPIKLKLGRPTTKKRKDKVEGPTGTKTNVKRKYNPIRCMYCGEVGHNKRTCSKKKQDDAQEKARLMQLQLAVVPPLQGAPGLKADAVADTQPIQTLRAVPPAAPDEQTEISVS
ncbi:hypothetical protein Ahy_A03g013279 [Arachis hypogaea]|uniref:CCHC-type domain-containing protein n=1 Tax=Arachis hypogaea TaxID=3818 RepID=A0A445DV14_ARAHY|nr:hypothetical protein Ahy_A03g013279 [Arachis hypogaea]